MDKGAPSSKLTELAALFVHCGYVRRLSDDRRQGEGQSYKKGYEVRFVLASTTELPRVRHLLVAAGLRAGRPFRKHARLVQPVYGRAAYEWFVAQIAAMRVRQRLGFASDGRRLMRRARAPVGSDR